MNKICETVLLDWLSENVLARIREVASDGNVRDVIRIHLPDTRSCMMLAESVGRALGITTTGEHPLFMHPDAHGLAGKLREHGLDVSYILSNEKHLLHMSLTQQQAHQLLVAHQKARANKDQEIAEAIQALHPNETHMITEGILFMKECLSPVSNAALRESMINGIGDEIASMLSYRELIARPPINANRHDHTQFLRRQVSAHTLSEVERVVGAWMDEVLMGTDTEHKEGIAIQALLDIALNEVKTKAAEKNASRGL